MGDHLGSKLLTQREETHHEKPTFVSYDAKIPSAIANSKVVDYGSVEEGAFHMEGRMGDDEDAKEATALDAKQRQIAGPILALGEMEEPVSWLFSKNWQNREKAMQHFVSNAGRHTKENSGIAGLMLAVQIGMKDKNWQVHRRAMELY